MLRTAVELLTDRQHQRLTAVQNPVQVEAIWGIYQRIAAAYRNPDRQVGKTTLTTVIAALSNNVPPMLTELITLGRTLTRRAADVLAYFDRPGTSHGPTAPRPHGIHQSPTSNTSTAILSASATSPTTS